MKRGALLSTSTISELPRSDSRLSLLHSQFLINLNSLLIYHLPASQGTTNRKLSTMAAPRKAVVVGVSGCSSSGKTTLARLLRDIFPNSFVLHEDDFYRAETE